MTPLQMAELLSYIKDNNCWGIGMYDVHTRHRKAIKYVDFCFDSRDGLVWSITFRTIVGGKEDSKHFSIEEESDCVAIKTWLDEVC